MAEGIKKVSENVIVANRALVITNPSVADNDAISIGALQSNPSKRGLKIKTAKGVYSKLDASEILEDLSITNNLLAPQCITKDKIKNGEIQHDHLEDDIICEYKIKQDAITRDKIKNGEVIQGKLAKDAVVNENLEDGCVTNLKIKEKTIKNDRLYDKTITNKKIADGTITHSLLDVKCVENENIDLNTIENDRYKDQSIYGDKIKNGGITNVHLDKNCVNTNNIMNGAVDGTKIEENAILEKHIDDGQIIERHLSLGCVTSTKLGKDSVVTEKIKDGSVTLSKLGSDVVGLIGDPVQYDKNNNVELRKNLKVNGNIEATGTIKADKIYNAVFMDLAEAYTPSPEECLVPGDIVELREDGFVYKANGPKEDQAKVIVGVVSNEYAQCFGATEEDLLTNQKVAVGMIGKVHVNVAGPVKIGDYIGACKDGVGVSNKVDLAIPKDYIIGKALETNNSIEPKKVLCLIFPN